MTFWDDFVTLSFIALKRRDTSIAWIQLWLRDKGEEPTLHPEGYNSDHKPSGSALMRANISFDIIIWLLFCSGISIRKTHQADVLVKVIVQHGNNGSITDLQLRSKVSHCDLAIIHDLVFHHGYSVDGPLI